MRSKFQRIASRREPRAPSAICSAATPGLTTSFAVILFAIATTCLHAQYLFFTNYGSSFDHELRSYRIDPDDTIELLDSEILDLGVQTSTNRLFVSPIGDWFIAPFGSPTYSIQLVETASDGNLTLKEHLDDASHSSLTASVRPDGAGFFTSTVEVSPEQYFRQFFFVEPDLSITPVNASQEYDPDAEALRNTVITHRGNYTIVGQKKNTYRTYHLDPDGSLGEISPPMLYESSPALYYASGLGISRDGRLVISAGSGTLTDAVSLWVGDDGTLTEVDKIQLPGSEDLAGGNIDSVLISPLREWVVFQGDWTELWDLNPDGSFAGRRWAVTETRKFSRADLSPDGRVVIVNHLVVADWTLSILRLSLDGDVESITQHVFDRPIVPVMFIPDRRPGDTNGDGWIDVTDLVILINHIRLGAEIPNPVDLDHADVDRSGVINEEDIDMLVEMILGQ